MEFLIVTLLFSAFALAAMRWGCDSREMTPDPELQKLRIMHRMTRYRHL